MRFSYSLTSMIMPLFNVFGHIPETLVKAIRNAGKRGNRTYYPTDLRRVTVILDTISDITGQHFEITVPGDQIETGIAWLRARLLEEEHLAEFGAAYAMERW
jgi:hypothetical protein